MPTSMSCHLRILAETSHDELRRISPGSTAAQERSAPAGYLLRERMFATEVHVSSLAVAGVVTSALARSLSWLGFSALIFPALRFSSRLPSLAFATIGDRGL